MNGQLTDSLVVDSTEETQEDALLPVRMARIEQDEDITHATDKALVYTYLNHPTLVRQTEDKVRSQRVFKEGIMPDSPRRPADDRPDQGAELERPGVNQDLVIRKPNFWKHSASASLQFTQNYISSNWYKGGESNNTMLSGLDISLNYDDKQRIQFDNRLEWKLGFTTSRSDTVHKYKTNTDLIRLTSKFGIKAFSSWYYTVQTELSTQLFGNYKTNSHEVNSSFLAPGYLKVDLGMDFKKT